MTRRAKVKLTVIVAGILLVVWSALFSRVAHVGFGTAIYWGLGAATTEGSSIPELTGPEQLLKCLMEITDLPFWLGTFALYQSWMATERMREHMEASVDAFKIHLESRFQHYLGREDHEQGAPAGGDSGKPVTDPVARRSS